MKQTVEQLVDDVIRKEYGGCHPKEDPFCILKARVVHNPPDHYIQVFVVGKWRSMRYYGGRGYIVKSKKILWDMERTVRINTGSHRDGKFYSGCGTFAGKRIIFEWVVPEQTHETLKGD